MKKFVFGLLVAFVVFASRWFRGDGVGEVDEDEDFYKVGGTSSDDP